MSSAGKFTIDVWTGGYPVWCVLHRKDGYEVKMHHSELSDLRYAVEKAMQEARNALPANYKDEV